MSIASRREKVHISWTEKCTVRIDIIDLWRTGGGSSTFGLESQNLNRKTYGTAASAMDGHGTCHVMLVDDQRWPFMHDR